MASAYALVGGNLVSFNLATPGAALGIVAVTGLIPGQTLVGLDSRVLNGQLYALGVNAATDTQTLYTLSTQTGVATAVGVPIMGIGDLPADGYSFDFFNPTSPDIDRIRVTTQQGNNFRINPFNGALSGLDPVINGAATGLSGVAFPPFAGNNTVYALDAASNSLMILGGIGGSAPGGPTEAVQRRSEVWVSATFRR